MKHVAFIQARMSSSRLPGKVLERIGSVPMIVFMLRRVARCSRLHQVVVATSTDSSDDPLSREVVKHGFACYRGDLFDVLGRFNSAAEEFAADVIVRLTGDCPLVDCDLIDRAVSILTSDNFQYVSNVDPATYPNGLDVEVFTRDALSRAHREARLPRDREHVTPYIRRHNAQFAQTNFSSVVDLSSMRWTVDHADDLLFVRALIDLLPPGSDPALADRFEFLRLIEVHGAKLPANRHVRNDYYSKSQDPTE